MLGSKCSAADWLVDFRQAPQGVPPVEFLAESPGCQRVVAATAVEGSGLAAVVIMTHVMRVVG